MFGQKTQPEMFFDSSVHLEAVSRILYLVENREPLGLLEGADGSGRSRVLSRVREELARTSTMIMSFNLRGMDEESALWQFTESLSARARSSMRRHELLSLLRDELSGRAQCGIQTVLLLDDFHRSLGELNIFLRILQALNSQCQGMLTVVVASDRALPGEFCCDSLLPIQLSDLNHADSTDFVRSLISHQLTHPARVDESAILAICRMSVGNAARISGICDLVRVVQEISPTTQITEETIESLLSEFLPGSTPRRPAPKSITRAG